MRIIALFMQIDWLGMFFDVFEDEPDTANSWALAAVVIAVLVAGLVFGFKGFRKYMADIAKRRIWTRRETWLTIFVGLFPIFFALLLVRWFDLNFSNFINFGDLLIGTLLGWVIYLVLMIVGHLVSPWRRELI